MRIFPIQSNPCSFPSGKPRLRGGKPGLRGDNGAYLMDWFNDLYLWAGFAVIAASAFIGIAYMLSKFFEIPVLEAWVKIELHELASSMVIAVFCVSMIATVNSAAQFLSGGSTDVIDAARSGFLQGELYKDGALLYKNLVGVYFELAKLTSYSYSAGLTYGLISAGYTSSPAAGLSPLQSEVGQALDAVANFMMLAASQSAFLHFFGNAAAVMLPVGIFLRSFSLTRKVGGVVLAGVISAAVIFPAGILISREIYDTFRPDLLSKIGGVHVKEGPDPPLKDVICSDIMKVFVSSPIPPVGGEMGWFLAPCITIGWLVPFFCSGLWYKIIEAIFFTINSLFPIIVYPILLISVATFESGLWGGSSGILRDYVSPIRDYALPAVSQYAVLSLVSFLLPLIITVTMVKNLAITFGGEPQLYGISKLI